MISVSQQATIGFDARFSHKKVTFGLSRKVVFIASLHDKLYLLDTSSSGNKIKSISDYSVCVNVCLDGLTMSRQNK